ncbi:MAG TPA: DUF4838 domain-containing protein [Bacteroidales bacterium]|nr:DUF4838 domain-containing protein [Bacteroidales bacterium]
MKKIAALIISVMLSHSLHAGIELVRDGKATGRIITDLNNKNESQASTLLNDFIKKITGTTLPVASPGGKEKAGDIIIKTLRSPDIIEDGFKLTSNELSFIIEGGEGLGTVYGVVTLLEEYLGVRYYAADEVTYPQRNSLSLPSGIKRIENPSFRHRQTQSYSMALDPLYKVWNRLEDPREIFAAGYWVHTFDRLLPSAKYGKSHPEYYSFINGERRPGSASQWCLTNEDVFEIVSHRIDSIFKANPDQKMISVSQNDGNFTNCQCENCKKIDDAEGGPSGSITYFLNKLAARFPDKEFSTLAYLYSMNPPKNIKPLPNVNIMLCDIDCYREVPLTDNPSGQHFMKALEGWAEISDNIFVWDYGINFDNYVSPFPNLHILQPNMQLFKKNNVNMHFSQIASIKGGDFSELRSYLVSKLLWNVNCNVDSVIRSFLKGYYGDAATYLYQYIKIQQGALLGSNIGLWIYDTPITHKTGMLNPNLFKTYRKLFDDAERSVASDSVLLKRVWQQRLTIQFAELEIARTGPMDYVERIKKELMLFRDRASILGVTTLNERRNTIEEYCDLYLKRNLPNPRKSLAENAPVTYTLPPNKPYDKIGDKALTDGLLGGATFNESWVGWEKNDGELIVDLGEIKEVEVVEADFLHKLGSWILLPKSMTCYTSVDNKEFSLLGKVDIPEDRSPEVKYVSYEVKTKQKVKARYIKVHFENVGIGPSWHYGVGYPVWFFTDEIWVY